MREYITVANMNDSKTETLLISSLEINAGARLEYHTEGGDYLDHKVMDPAIGLPYTIINEPKIKMDDNWGKKAFSLNVVYKMTHKFGLLGEANYNEQGGHLESHFSGNNLI